MLRFENDPDRLRPAERDDLDPRTATVASAIERRRLRLRKMVLWSLVLLTVLFLVIVSWLATVAPPSQTARPIVPPRITFLASDGTLISRRGAITEKAVDVGILPAHVGNAFVAIEDRRFYHHYGLDPRGLMRAAWHDVRSGSAREGGSTITQQLAKLVYLNSDRSVGRKIREALIALWLERWLSKDQILSRYLSNAYFGDNVYGLRAAARHYFSKSPERLTVGEAALLAGLMKAPSRLAPNENLAGARARAALVSKAMLDAGFITPHQAAEATAHLRLKPAPEPKQATYFSDWAASAAMPPANAYAEQIVRTTLDARLQRLAETAVGQVRLPGAQVALVAMRPDGKVVAMVGGRNYAASSFNRATQARRQPGSTFKLFVYLAAVRAGMTPNDLVEDRPIVIGSWSPRNADGQYLGPITLREAFARSSNVAAVRLTQRVGPEAVSQAARDLGIRSPLNPDPGIALGTSGVTLLELAGSYAAVAHGAYPIRPYGLALASPERSARTEETTFSDADRATLLDLLSTTVNSGTARGAALTTQVYGKTGTSQDNRDALFVGFAGGLVTAVWIGRDDNRPMPGIAGGGLPAHVWRTFMAGAIGAKPAPNKVPDTVDPDAGIDGIIHSVVGRLKSIFHF
ncbi:penicillin-binding protein [Sphingomonas sp. AP4-R1]|uniref:transglycosylase domain-containing protein n=1 Tax=Sphingomonas sp. AP4-R1 TaxID=2735134 RepID=UPI0014939FF8|nr:transglycosylase domain-containing protein [Sphingomonas sp. AP4-R1]QJU59358.1 penicillin-binding protein [Sphingomonas sp. AP4-R1]